MQTSAGRLQYTCNTNIHTKEGLRVCERACDIGLHNFCPEKGHYRGVGKRLTRSLYLCLGEWFVDVEAKQIMSEVRSHSS